MIRLLQWLFVGHVHRWKTLSSHPLTDWSGKKQTGVAYIQQCEGCGMVKRRDLR